MSLSVLLDASLTDQERALVAKGVVAKMADETFKLYRGSSVRAMSVEDAWALRTNVHYERQVAIEFLDDCYASACNVGAYCDDAKTVFWRRLCALQGGAE